jgi:ABC-2 type transport system permease protein
MNTPLDAKANSPLDTQSVTPVALSATRLFDWSIRREFWEFRSLYLAPLGAAALYLIGFLLGAVHLPAKMRAAMALHSMEQHDAVALPYHFAALLLMGTAIIVGIFYSLDALYGERRDRSILFWKSLPVSDLTTVLSKATIPIILLPLIAFAVTIALQSVMLLVSTLVLFASGQSVVTFWSELSWFQMSSMLFFHLLGIHGLWYAPIYGYLVLVSAWARRAPFLWAALPPIAICFVEKIAFNTSHIANLLLYRLSGENEGAPFTLQSASMDPIHHLDLGRFLSSSGLWIGLACTAIFLVAAARLRRSRGPI